MDRVLRQSWSVGAAAAECDLRDRAKPEDHRRPWVVNPWIDALRRAAEAIDVPGTPRSLQLDTAEVVGDVVRLVWSFVDPEVLRDDVTPHGRRIQGHPEVRLAEGLPDEVARSWWAQAQLAAARRYKYQIDADWIPGEPVTPQEWTPQAAWKALLTYLASDGWDVEAQDDEIRVSEGSERTTFRIDPAAWAAYLNAPGVTDACRRIPSRASGNAIDQRLTDLGR